jgi:pyroglutamyl-peptidase
MNKRILITGFEPFGGDTENPSDKVVGRLRGRMVAGRKVVGLTLPVVFGESCERLRAAIEEVQPEVVICLGLAANRQGISLERIAINIDDARMPDNRNQQPIDQAIEPDGPAAYWTRLPIKALRERLIAAGFAAEISQSAGTYVCNHLFYGLMHALEVRPGVRGGFVHVPAAPSELDLETLTAAVELIVETTLAIDRDLPTTGGAIS